MMQAKLPTDRELDSESHQKSCIKFKSQADPTLILSWKLIMWLSSVYAPPPPAFMYWQHLGTFLMRQWTRSCGSPPWPETGHQWAPGQSVESLGSVVCTDTSHPRGSQLESGLGTMRAMYCTYVYGLTMALRISSLDLVQQSGFHWLAHGGVYASPDVTDPPPNQSYWMMLQSV